MEEPARPSRPRVAGRPQSRDLPDDLTGARVGRYAVLSLLGKGGMGEVYLAQHLRLKHVVALKRLASALREHPDYRARFLNEGKRASKLTHECIARVFDFFEEQDEPFLVMEYIEGTSLRQRIQSPVSVEEALQIVSQTAEALAAA